MLRRLLCAFVLMLSASVAVCSAQAPQQGVPLDQDDWLTLVPELTNASGPTWLAPGFEMAHEYSVATVPGAWQTYAGGNGTDNPCPNATPTASAHGYAILDVVGITGNAAACVMHQTMFAPSGQLAPSNDVPTITAVGASNAWLGPEALAKIGALQANGLSVQHAPYTISGVQFQGMWVTYRTDQAYTVWIYDAQSGILLHQQIVAPGPDAQSATITDVTYRHSRTLQIPWLGAAAPPWVSTFNNLNYAGTMTAQAPPAPPGMPNMPQQQTPSMTLGLTVQDAARRRGSSWVELATHTVQTAPGMPDQSADGGTVCGNGSFGGVFIPPSAISALQPGQVLDTDPVTGFKTEVVGMLQSNGRNVFVIRQSGPVHTTDFGYDPSNGMLVTYTNTSNAVGQVTQQITLSGSN